MVDDEHGYLNKLTKQRATNSRKSFSKVLPTSKLSISGKFVNNG